MGFALPAGLTLEPLRQTALIDFIPEPGSSNADQDRPKIDAYLLQNAMGESAPFFILPGLEVEISASLVREGIQSPLNASAAPSSPELGMLPHAVLDYIRDRGLYR
jgi:hypothetical protein